MAVGMTDDAAVPPDAPLPGTFRRQQSASLAPHLLYPEVGSASQYKQPGAMRRAHVLSQAEPLPQLPGSGSDLGGASGAGGAMSGATAVRGASGGASPSPDGPRAISAYAAGGQSGGGHSSTSSLGRLVSSSSSGDALGEASTSRRSSQVAYASKPLPVGAESLREMLADPRKAWFRNVPGKPQPSL